jgi:hypothetical protein
VSERGSVEAEKLLVIWSTADREVAENMIFMYLGRAMEQNWWDRVRLVVWGPSARLVADDPKLQAGLKEMIRTGVEIYACRECTERYGVSGALADLGITVQNMGEPLSEMLTLDWVTLSF